MGWAHEGAAPSGVSSFAPPGRPPPALAGRELARAGDDDDSAGACADVPLPDSPEWAPLGGSLAFTGQGGGPEGPGEARVWFVPNDVTAADLFAEFGPVTDGSGGGILDVDDLTALFDETDQDLFVVSYVVEAAGECVVSGDVYTNTIIDAVVYGIHVHRDTFGPSVLPAFSVTTDVIVVTDIGYDGAPGFPIVQPLWTERDLTAR